MKKPPFTFFLCSVLSCLLAGSALGQGITLLKDINAQGPTASPYSADTIVNVNGTLFISTDDNLSGAELWKSDGTLAGTVLVKDIMPGIADSGPRQLTSVGTGAASRLFFTAITGVNEENLWMSNGTAAGTTVVQDFNFPSGGPEKLFAIGDTLYFEGFDTTARRELWKSSATGTAVRVKDINTISGEPTSGIDNLTDLNGILLFTANDGTNGKEIWRSNGNPDDPTGTRMVVDTNTDPQNFVVFNNHLFFSGQDPVEGGTGRELYRSNGTSTALIFEDIEPNGSSDPGGFLPMGTHLYFAAQKTGEGRELWRTDGISVTERVKNIGIAPSAAFSSDPANLISISVTQASPNPPREVLLFTAHDGSTGVELWRSDGTDPGTTLEANLATGDTAEVPKSSNPANFVKYGPTTVIFTATDAAGTLSLYKSEGGVGNDVVTTKVVDFVPEAGDTTAVARSFVLVTGTPNKVYFLLNDDEFWVTDSTAVGTTRIKRFRAGESLTPAVAGSDPEDFTSHGGGTSAFFSADDGLLGRELWKTDGTPDGTTMVADILDGVTGSNPLHITSGDDVVFFSAIASGSGRELWKYSTITPPEGDPPLVPELVLDIAAAASSSFPEDLFWAEGGDDGLPNPLLFFSASTNANGRELWRSDGTAGGTFMVKDMVTGSGNSNPEDFAIFKNRLYFSGAVSGVATELLSTEGVLDDIIVTDIASGGGSSDPSELTVMATSAVSEFLYFAAEAASKGRELWRFDGTTKPTQPVKDINTLANADSNPTNLTVIDKTLYFIATNGIGTGKNGRELWKTTGTDAGTVMVRDIAPGVANAFPVPPLESQMVAIGTTLFFVADDGTNGAELWISNGTAAGTVMVKNIVAGSGSPGIQGLTTINGVAVFTADDGVNGREVWISDGTALGTFIIRDLTNDGASSNPLSLFALGNRLLYSAATYVRGQEPRIGLLEPEIVVEHPAATVLVSGTVAPIDFGTASLVNSQSLDFHIRNDGLNTLKGVGAVFSGTHATDFSVATKPPVTVGQDVTITVTVKFSPKGTGVRTATLTFTNNDPDESAFTINLTGTGEAVFAVQPAAQMAVVGDNVQFNAGISAAGDGAPTLQWRKNNANILGATAALYDIPSVALTHAGAYTVQVKLTATATSDIAQLGVVDNTPKLLILAAGATANFTVTAAGNGLSYKWRRIFTGNPVEDLPADLVKYKNRTTKALMVSKLTTADSATYVCEVTGPGGTKVGGTTELRVFDSSPVIMTFDPPNGIVSGPYSYQVVMSTDTDEAATTYSATKMPPGLKIDPKTGLISGFPTKAGTYDITITTSNTKGKPTAHKVVTIAQFPANLAGNWVGPVERDGLNGNLGGRIELVITPTGTFTGGLFMGSAAKLALKGQLNVDVDQTVSGFLPNGACTVKRLGALLPLNVIFKIENNTLHSDSQVNDGSGGNIAGVGGWRQVWHTTANPATNYLGYHTMALMLAGGPDSLPQGVGYGSFTVAKDGKLTIAGKTADGEGLTGGTFIGPTGQLMIFNLLYTTPTKGSIRGQLQIGPGTNPDLTVTTDNTIAGTLDWLRPADLRTTARTYELGFGTPMAVDVDVVGGRYGPVPLSQMVMGVTAGEANVRVVFTKGGLDDAEDNPNLVFNLGPNNKVSVPASTTSTKLTLAAGTGIFSGSFVLEEANPRTTLPVAPATVKRTVNYYGILIRDDLGEEYGVGYFMLPQLPGNGPPATTPTTSDILSGAVLFEPVPPGP